MLRILLWAICLIGLLCIRGHAQDTLLDPARREAILATYPDSDDPEYKEVLAAARTRGIPYDDATMPPVIQDADSNRQGLHSTNGLFGRRHSSGQDFPWAVGFGMTRAENASRNFMLVLPDGRPIAWRLGTAIRRDGRREGRTYSWYFPAGTVLLEKISTHGIPFQVNTLTKTSDGRWEPNVFRMFRDNYEFAEALGDSEPQLKAALLNPTPIVEYRQEADTIHELESTFSATAAFEVLPAFSSPNAAIAFIRDRKLVSVKGRLWRVTDPPLLAPTVRTDGPHIVAPVGFMGGIMGVNQQNCNQCHRDTGRHVSNFDQLNEFNGVSRDRPLTQDRVRRQNGRHWYGLVRGSDSVLSFHIFAPEYIATGINGGGFRQVNQTGNPEIILRRSLIDAGLLVQYDGTDKVRFPDDVYRASVRSHR